MSAFHLYTAYAIVPTQTLRPIHVAFVLFLCFLVSRSRSASGTASCGGTGSPRCSASPSSSTLIQGGDDFMDRTTAPERLDIVLRRRR